MTRNELLSHIKQEVLLAASTRNKDAVNMYLVIKYADKLRDINPIDFAEAIGRKESYATEFRKGLNLAKVIADRGL